MLSAKQSHVSPSFDTSILRDLEPAAQEHPEMEDANQPWLDSEFGAPKESDSYIVGDNEREVKRFHPTAFFGSRGKRLEGHFGEAILKHDPMTSFHSRNEVDDLSVNEEDYDDDVSNPSKRFDPSGFAGSRGKRYLPGLEAFLLSQMYHKCEYMYL